MHAMHAHINNWNYWINHHQVAGFFIMMALGIGALALITGAVQLATRGSVITQEELAANSPSAAALREHEAREQ
jgi:hypothetical protein